MFASLKSKYQSFADFLDRGGSLAWIAASALGFIFFWPLGVLLTASMFGRGYAPVPPARTSKAQNR